MNILELVFSKAWGGLEIIFSIYSDKFRQQEHNVIAVIEPNQKMEQQLKKNDIKYILIKPFTKYLDILTARKIKKLLNETRIDIIQVYQSKDLSTAILLKKFLKSGKIVFSQHMDFRHDKFDFFHKWIYRNLDRIVCVTNDMRKNHIEHTSVLPDKISVIHNGTDLNRFNLDINFNKKAFLREKQIPGNRLIIGTIGRLDRLKNQAILIEAAGKLTKRYKNKIHFIIVGDETDSVTGRNYKNELIENINRNNLQNYFSFFEFSDEVEKYFSVLDIFILTTPKESFGLVLTEAMAMAKPIIASNSGGPVEIIQDGINGFLFEPNDVEDLISKLSNLISNENLRIDMGKKSKEIVKQKFDLNKKVQEYLVLFERLQ